MSLEAHPVSQAPLKPRAAQTLLARLRRASRREEGQSLVEMAISMSFFMMLLFGVVQFGFAEYCVTWVSEAARESTRYAVIRGANSCYALSSFTNCNLLPGSASNLQTWIRGQGFPFANGITLTTTWWAINPGPPATWTTACTGSVDSNNVACNNPGNAVRVVATYSIPIRIPFWKSTSIAVSSTSQEIILN